MGNFGYITTENTPPLNAFKYTEILDDSRPYYITGYAKGTFPGTYGEYLPPEGWRVKSCIKMENGTHGMAAGEPVVLVTCERIAISVMKSADVEETNESTSELYQKPSNRIVISGKIYTINAATSRTKIIETGTGLVYSVSGLSLANLGYTEGEDIVAVVYKYDSSDNVGCLAEFIDIRRASEPEKATEIIREDAWYANRETVKMLTAGSAIVGTAALLYLAFSMENGK
ncbi:MAG TPA: hypothetical protein PLW50_00530 [Smithellaceae bacterium]|nr:hypothetical protein [Smithellaceae bacterium]